MKVIDFLLNKKPKNKDSKGPLALEMVRQWKKESVPLESLGMTISTAALKGGDQMKPHLNFPTEQEKHERWFWVQCEFLYFFLHLVNRVALNKLGVEKRRKIHDKLAPLVLKSFVEVLCGFLPSEEQEQLIKHLYENLMAAELDYAPCTEIIAKENPFDGKYLFSVLGSKLSAQSGNDGDPIAFVEIATLAYKIYQETDLVPLILELGEIIK